MILNRSTQFKKDYALIQQQGKDVSKLDAIFVRLHCGNDNFDGEYKVYPYSVGWTRDYFVLYIETDWVLVYKINHTAGEVLLVRTGHPREVS